MTLGLNSDTDTVSPRAVKYYILVKESKFSNECVRKSCIVDVKKKLKLRKISIPSLLEGSFSGWNQIQ
jgi:hypothetical protein